jgi:hypothetical protein
MSKSGSHMLVAGIEKMGARSGAILAGLSRFEGSNRLPVTATWEHVPAIAVPAAQRVAQSNNWNGPARGVSALRMPAATLMRRTPVKIMPPMLPRLGR